MLIKFNKYYVYIMYIFYVYLLTFYNLFKLKLNFKVINVKVSFH